MKFTKSFVGVSLLLVAGFFMGFVTHYSNDYYEISKNLDIFGKLFRDVNTMYVDDTDPEKLIRTGIDAMLESLDPYTTFISEEESDQVRFLTKGEYGGIGALVGKRKGRILIIEPYEDYPADEAGIKAGDQLIKVKDSVITPEMTIADVRDLLRGKKGTEVDITVLRNGAETQLRVRRDRIKIPNVPYYGFVREDVGYIALEGFTQDASQELIKALEQLKATSKDLKGVMLDLRGNTGGRLDEAIYVSNVFIRQNEAIVETRGRVEGSQRKLFTRRPATDTEIPLVVLIDGRSASASEIVAGAIQDLDRGVIVGQKSFGKGLVQDIRPLSYNAQLKITTAKYYTPSGRCIQAINYRERDANGKAMRIPDSLRNTFATRNGREVKDGGGISPDISIESPDSQPLLAAIISEGLIFDFATQYAAGHSELTAPKSFHVDDAIFSEFKSFVRTKDLSLQTPLDSKLEEITEDLKEEGYYASLTDELATLEKAIQEKKSRDLGDLQGEISLMLEQEIAKRYYYKQGIVEVSFDDDPEILAGLAVLDEPNRYKEILQK
ncbi:MAG: S41 family peptidase [Bacteroidota bacterium]